MDDRPQEDALSHSYVRDWIYGGIDGAVTTFAIVSGVVGGHLSYWAIIVLGLSNVIADGFSMAASNFLGTKSEHEEYLQAQLAQKSRIQTDGDAERDRIRRLFAQEGIEEPELEQLTQMVTRNPNLWVSLLLHEAHGLPKSIRSPFTAALSTFVAFLLCGMVPLLPYFLQLPNDYLWSISLTGTVFFLIGSMKSRYSLNSWWYSGSVTLAIGASVAFIAYGIGYGFHWYFGAG